MVDVEVIDDPAAAAVALDPVRNRLLAELAEPASAAILAERLGIPRQKINYHLRALEAHGLVEVARTRSWGGLTERLLVATASAYVVSPGALGPVAVDLQRPIDRLSVGYLIALAARAIREVSRLARLAGASGRAAQTFSIDASVCFRSPAERAAFAGELTQAVNELVARYHHASESEGRWHRLIVAAHPIPPAADSSSPDSSTPEPKAES